MQCPFCKKDYKDVPPGRPPGGFFRGDPHFYEPRRRLGMICMNSKCGKVAEFITAPTGKEYTVKIEHEQDEKNNKANQG